MGDIDKRSGYNVGYVTNTKTYSQVSEMDGVWARHAQPLAILTTYGNLHGQSLKLVIRAQLRGAYFGL